MTAQVIIADPEQHALHIRELFWEYLQWANARVKEEFVGSTSGCEAASTARNMSAERRHGK